MTSIRVKPIENFQAILAQQQALSLADAQRVESQLNEAYAVLGEVEYFANEDIRDTLVAQELRYRFHLRDAEKADAIRDDLREQGVGITRYELGDWFLLEQMSGLSECSSEEQHRSSEEHDPEGP